MTACGLVITAPRSGSGKTTVTLGLLRALSRAGVAVAGAKCGPDYIDPAFHARACGRPSLNLDSWAMTPASIASLAAEASAGCDLVLCEGLMGLFDGVPGPEGRTGSTADIATALGWPVLLVHDASGQAQSAAAQIAGCLAFDPRITIAGVILNRVGSPRHRRLIEAGLGRFGVPVVASLPKAPHLALPERHLGLVQADETADLDAKLDAMADFLAAHVDLSVIGRLARNANMGDKSVSSANTPSSPPKLLAGRIDSAFPSPLWKGVRGEGRAASGRERGATMLRRSGADPHPQPLSTGERGAGGASDATREADALSFRLDGSRGRAIEHPSLIAPPGRRIALAQDAAFSFVYPHVLQGWQRLGATMLPFSPLADEPPPDDADACWLPGGYPELHGARLASATRFMQGLRSFAETRPVHGECGGYMVLGESLTDAAGVPHAMAGLLSVATSFAQRKLHLGYREATLLGDTCLGPAGTVLRGHEFHYATVLDAGRDPPLASVRTAYDEPAAPAGSRRGFVTGSFFHLIAATQQLAACE